MPASRLMLTIVATCGQFWVLHLHVCVEVGQHELFWSALPITNRTTTCAIPVLPPVFVDTQFRLRFLLTLSFADHVPHNPLAVLHRTRRK